MQHSRTLNLTAFVLMLLAVVLVSGPAQARKAFDTSHTAKMARGELTVELGPKVLANKRKTKAVHKLALLSMLSDYISLRLDELKLRDTMTVRVTLLTLRIGRGAMYAPSHITASVTVSEGDKLLGQFDTTETTGLGGRRKATVAKWLSRGMSIRVANGVQDVLSGGKGGDEADKLTI